MIEAIARKTKARPAATGGLRRAHVVVALVGACAAACGDDLPDPPEVGMTSSSTTDLTGITTITGPAATGTTLAPTDTEEGVTSTTSGGPSSVGIPDECTVSADCSDGELCVAPFDQSAGPEGKGAYACVTECVELMDEDRWCADVAACCDPLAECTDRGYCVTPEGTTGGTESGSTESGGTESSGSSSGGTTG